MGMFVVSIPYVTKPTMLNLTILVFVDIDLTSLKVNLLPENSYDTNTSIHVPTNVHSNIVSG